MKVVHLSSSDISGGAFRAAYRIHQGLPLVGVESKMVVLSKRSDDPTVTCVAPVNTPGGFARRLFNRLRNRRLEKRFVKSDCDMFTDCRPPFSKPVTRALNNCDVVHLHWIANFVNLPNVIPYIATRFPIVWTLHDMNPFTGGCHYDAECGRYRNSCGSCPAINSSSPTDISRKIWKDKKTAFDCVSENNIRIVGDSEWLSQCARESSILGRFRTSTIHYGLDQTIFQPTNQAKARVRFGIPAEARVVMFCAISLDNTRKGLSYLLESLQQLRQEPDLFLLMIGAEDFQIDTDIPYRMTGSISDDRVLAMAYSAADVFVIPSKQEAFGQVTLEAMACGVPSVGFAVGGIVDLIQHKENSLLVKKLSSGDLAAAIKTVIDDPHLRKKLSTNGLLTVSRNHTLQIQAQKYASLYSELLNC